MKKQRNNKLRIYHHLFLQICVSFGAILICFALCIGLIFTNLYENDIIDTYRKQLRLQAKHIAKEVKHYIVTDDAEGCFLYQDYLDSIANSENTDIWLIDNPDDDVELKREFTNVDIVDIPFSDEVESVLRRAKKGKTGFSTGYDAIYEKTMMCAAAPITNKKKEVVGIVLLHSFVEQRDALIAGSRQYITYSIFAGIGIALLLAIILAKFITKPITRMREAANEMTDGNYAIRIDSRVKNELGSLAGSLDTLAERLEENEMERQQNEQARLDFFANVSHELRTPITVMRGYSESLADGVISSEEKKLQYYQRMVNECQSMERLVGDLLTLSKVQNPHFTIEKEPVNLIQIFQDVLRSYKGILEQRQMKVHFDYQDEVMLILGDYDRLRQLFLNIINNAMKFSEDGSNIWITVQRQEQLIVSIRDEGVGIAKEELPNIFSKFYKSKLRQNAKGSGLGLVIAKYIVEKHGGRILAQSEVGKGTTFIIAFEEYLDEWEGN